MPTEPGQADPSAPAPAPTPSGARPPVTYLLPIRHRWTSDTRELTPYLARIATRCEVIVVDGSDAASYARAHQEWSRYARHVAPDPALACANGKVHGVLTGLRLARHEIVVIADDDVRYELADIEVVCEHLRHVELVCPQNYFWPLPWHARWDTARTLLNRAIGGGDFPGTLALRAGGLDASRGYAGDVLFENLELIRTVRANGGRVRMTRELFVRRTPPSAAHFWSQRVRQAYDELARPVHLLVELALLPAAVAGWRRSKRGTVLALTALPMILGEFGRRRHGGRFRFPASSSVLAPLWLAERAVCIWVAVFLRLRGGCRYAGGTIRVAAHSTRELRRRRRDAFASWDAAALSRPG